jgi:hypothetical protein
MKRLVLALAVAGVIFGGVYGLAASLGMSTQSLGAGNATVAACQSGTLTATYATAYDSAVPAYEVTTVTVNGLQSGCYSLPYRITLTGAANASLVEVTGTTPGSGTSFTTSSVASSNISAASVTGIHVVITG